MEKTQKCCLYSVCEVMVHLHELRSFDLPLTSSYCIRTTIECAQTSDSNSANAALFARNREIVGYFEVNHTERLEKRQHNVENSKKTDEEAFLSRKFMVRYPDESVSIEDVVIFRCILPTALQKTAQKTALVPVMVFELLHTYNVSGSKPKPKVLATAKLTVGSIFQSHYSEQCQFAAGGYFATLSVAVHSALMEMCVLPDPLPQKNIRVIPEKMVAFLMPDAFTDDSVKAFCRRQHAFRSRFMRSHQSLRDEIKQLHTCVKGSTPPNKPLIEPLQAQFECSPHNIQNDADCRNVIMQMLQEITRFRSEMMKAWGSFVSMWTIAGGKRAAQLQKEAADLRTQYYSTMLFVGQTLDMGWCKDHIEVWLNARKRLSHLPSIIRKDSYFRSLVSEIPLSASVVQPRSSSLQDTVPLMLKQEIVFNNPLRSNLISSSSNSREDMQEADTEASSSFLSCETPARPRRNTVVIGSRQEISGWSQQGESLSSPLLTSFLKEEYSQTTSSSSFVRTSSSTSSDSLDTHANGMCRFVSSSKRGRLSVEPLSGTVTFFPFEFLDGDGEGVGDTRKTKMEEKHVSLRGTHLVVLVHGLGGDALDMMNIHHQLLAVGCKIELFAAKSLEGKTHEDIRTLASLLVAEISTHIKHSVLSLRKLSFIGYSLGSVVIRAALQDDGLLQFKDKLHSYVSLAGPHIGVSFNDSSLVSGAMWVWKKWAGSKSMEQLALSDATEVPATFLYKLSLQESLSLFSNVMFVGSEQDKYVPCYSAVVEPLPTFQDGNVKSAFHQNMIDAIMGHLGRRHCAVSRVYLDLEQTNANSNLSSAHLAFIASPMFVRAFAHLFAPLFAS